MSTPDAEFAPGVPVGLARGVRRIVAPNAGLMTGPGTNTYLVGTEEFAVIDPGPDDPGHLDAILRAASGCIRQVLVTHTHRDHSPLAAVLAQRTGATLMGLAPPGDGRQDLTFRPDRVPGDGERLPAGDATLTALHTPGHASNCVCYLFEDRRLLFTGDHILAGVTPVILPPDGDMAAYLRSLDRLEACAFDDIAPGHGGLLSDGKVLLGRLRRHRLAREAKVLRCLERMPAATLEALVPVVYDDVGADRHAWAKLTLQAHLIKLAAEHRASEVAGTWRATAA